MPLSMVPIKIPALLVIKPTIIFSSSFYKIIFFFSLCDKIAGECVDYDQEELVDMIIRSMLDLECTQQQSAVHFLETEKLVGLATKSCATSRLTLSGVSDELL